MCCRYVSSSSFCEGVKGKEFEDVVPFCRQRGASRRHRGEEAPQTLLRVSGDQESPGRLVSKPERVSPPPGAGKNIPEPCPVSTSIIEKGEENCGDLIEAHKDCMRALGFKI
ncbi:unnamed protein product [Menidia menidia]|uniref:(Atlantic silverside) hypothetical protein n=1 Tax=Menidia menidia TaxID=238744 RepID=A0A8S4AER3_9TELE|nr:unnamed protein product [Menidia menidia]